MQIVGSFFIEAYKYSYKCSCHRVLKKEGKKISFVKKEHFYLCKNLTKTAAKLHLNYDFQITFWRTLKSIKQ